MMQVIAQRLTVVWLAEYKLWCKLWISLLVGFNGKVIVKSLRAKRSDNFMPRVMRKRLRAHFHNFDHNFAVLANREPSRQFCVIELIGHLANYARLSSRV